MLKLIARFLGLTIASLPQIDRHDSLPRCKAVPGSSDWPSALEWSILNSSISGRLIQPVPPGAVCHPNQPSFDALACPAVQSAWLTTAFHSQDPVSSDENNWNNDTCLPIPSFPCSGKGYPVYVINATSASDIKAGVDFARKNYIRLIVKATGHDYLGRSSAPNSLSIWTHHMKGISIHDAFRPNGCNFSIETPAITMAAGTQFGELNLQASLKNLTVVSGGAADVGIVGYITGGGHGALSATYGMAADNVLEMEIVSPRGEILTINECQNSDLFWAMRGGGGSTFGVVSSVTVRAFPAKPLISLKIMFPAFGSADTFWNAMTYFISQYPTLSAQGITGYSTLRPYSTPRRYVGSFLLPVLSPLNSTTSMTAAFHAITNKIRSMYRFGFLPPIITTAEFADFQSWFAENEGPLSAGSDFIIGSRLIPAEVLGHDPVKLKLGLSTATPNGGGLNIYILGGKGVKDAIPRGGDNAVNPAWRTSLLHCVGGGWMPLDANVKAKMEELITNKYAQALRVLAPDSGAYVNEADPNEPDFQHSFWGKNYERLLEIKRENDPEDVFWCHPCVGNERWEVVGDMLCRV